MLSGVKVNVACLNSAVEELTAAKGKTKGALFPLRATEDFFPGAVSREITAIPLPQQGKVSLTKSKT